MSRLTRDGTAEPVSRDEILRGRRGQATNIFPCSADHEQDWQFYPVDPHSPINDDHSGLGPPPNMKTGMRRVMSPSARAAQNNS